MAGNNGENTSGLIGAGEGDAVTLGGMGVIYKAIGRETGGAFAIVEHPLQPGALAAPPHTHTREDELSIVIEGEIGVQIGEEVYSAGPGTYIRKPRGMPHTFWNATDRPARLIEIISPAGFEEYFREAAAVLAASNPPDMGKLLEIAARYGLTLHMERIASVMAAHKVTL